MNGNKYFLDTNAIIALLKGNTFLETTLSDASWIKTSSIVIIEFLSFQGLQEPDKKTFELFISRIHVEGLPIDLASLQLIANIRLQHGFKLPDAIIVAQCLQNNAQLISNDKQLKSFVSLSF